MKCKYSYCKNEVVIKHKTNTLKVFCSKQCKNKYNSDKVRVLFKLRAVHHLGGKCQKCGYDKCIAALEFHHRNPKTKKFNLNSGNMCSWQTFLNEVEKCDLLCANCHREEGVKQMNHREEFFKEIYQEFLAKRQE